MTESTNIAFADIGNSRIKIFDGLNYLCLSYDKNLLIKLKSFIEFQEISKIYYSSVNSEFEHILHLTFENDIELINILNQMETQKIINFDADCGVPGGGIN